MKAYAAYAFIYCIKFSIFFFNAFFVTFKAKEKVEYAENRIEII